jgi:hypothetical protein
MQFDKLLFTQGLVNNATDLEIRELDGVILADKKEYDILGVAYPIMEKSRWFVIFTETGKEPRRTIAYMTEFTRVYQIVYFPITIVTHAIVHVCR